MIYFKKISLIILILFFLISITKADYTNRIVYIVGNEIISEYDIKVEKEFLLLNNTENYENTNNEILNNIASKSLVAEKIKKVEIEKYSQIIIDDDFINIQLEIFMRRNNFKNINDLKSILKNKKYIDFEYIKEKITLELQWNNLIYNKYKNKISLDENKINKILNEILKKNKIEQYLLSEIFIYGKTLEDLEDKKKKVMDSIKTNGFKNTAIQFSDSPTSTNGGALDWLNVTLFDKKIYNEVKGLKIGDISGPVNINNGLLFIKLENKRKIDKKVDENKLLEDIIKSETNKILNQYSLKYFNQIKNSANVIEKND